MRMSVRTWTVVSGMLSASLLLGCGEPRESLVPVGGTLLIDGEPLDGVVVTFTPEKFKKSPGGAGTTDDDGAFTVTHLGQNQPGLAPGKYSLSYSRKRLPDGSAAGEPDPEKPGQIQVETLPDHMTIPDMHSPSRQVEIPADGDTSLELKATKKKTGPPTPGGIPAT